MECKHDFELFTDSNSGMKMWICKKCKTVKYVMGEI